MIKQLGLFISDIIKSRRLIIELARRDYRQQNQGSYLGLVWNYLQPLLFIAVLYSVFTLGFRSVADMNKMPFSVYLVSGMVCWLYFSVNFTALTSVIKTYSFLVKKVNFRLSILPIVKLVSTTLPHLILFCLTIVLAYYHGIEPGLHTLQFLYYFGCMILLLLGLGWLTASTSIFVKDVANIVAIVTQFGMWLSPIFWNMEAMPDRIQGALKLNPVYYLVSGYRDSLTGDVFFWQRPIQETATFWLITIALVVAGALAFKRLKPHFAEVI